MVGDGAAPLSFGAEQFLVALDRIVDGQAVTPARWLLALAEADRILAGQVAGEHRLPTLEAAAGSDTADGEPLTRADIAQLAGESAAAGGRPVAGKGDVANAILTLQGSPPTMGAGAPLPETGAAPADEDPPLSFGAEQLIAALVPEEGTCGPAELLVALVDDHAPVVERASIGDVASWETTRLARELVVHGTGGRVWSRAQVTAAASARSRQEGHRVVTPADVIRAVVDEVDAQVNPEPTSPTRTATPEATQLSLTLEAPVQPVTESGLADELTGPESTTVTPHPIEPREEAPAGEAARPATGRARTFRVFVSSTFDDFTLERDVLREHVWPRLQRFCEQRGARFQAVDLRWGVSSEAAADQQTMNICLGEIERCHRVTPRPNFLVLVGEHYGWRPLPPQVPATEYDRLVEHLSPEDRALADQWYEADRNAQPAQRRLRPRPEGQSDVEWAQVERRLRPALEAAARWGDIDDDRRRVYHASATEQEILRGALEAGDPDQVVCVLRRLDTTAADPSDRDRIARFVDVDPAPVDTLRAELRARLGARIVRSSADSLEFVVPWGDPDAGLDYLTRFAEGVATMLEGSIDDELREPRRRAGSLERPNRPIPADDLLDDEGWAHHDFAEERTAVFAGRDRELAAIHAYLDGDDAQPLAVTGGGGTGKSALMGEVVRHALEGRPGDVVVYRFVGATPGSADARTLLESICRELARRRGEPEQSVPTDFRELVVDFRARLQAPPGRRVLVFIDSLDQLSASDGARGLSWVPGRLPDGARLVVSTRPGDTLDPLQGRAELLEVPGLEEEDGRAALTAWLGDACRTLQRDQEAEVLHAFGRSERNPLYLRLAFEEACRWWSERDHEPLASVTGPDDASVVAPIIRDNLLARLEAEHGAVLVEHALGYLACARFGLAESELLDLLAADPDVYRWFLLGSYHLPVDVVSAAVDLLELAGDGSPSADVATPDRAWQWLTDAVAAARSGTDARPLDEFLDAVLGAPGGPSLPVVLWSRLFFDLEPYLKEGEADGVTVLDFYHRELRDVAGDRYAGGERGRVLHERLARYFQRRADPDGQGTWEADGGRVDARGLAELPYHLTGAQDWDGLYETLTDFSFLERKAAHVGVLRRHDADGESTLYTGVYRLQDDFDRALHHMRGEGDGPERPQLIVTAVDLGAGLVVRCPHCNTVHPFQEAWKGTEIVCPNPQCRGPLKVNPFVAERV